MENVCFYCGKEIENLSEKYMIGIDIPYINIYVHKECYRQIFEYGEEAYLQENKYRIFELSKKEVISNQNKRGKK